MNQKMTDEEVRIHFPSFIPAHVEPLTPWPRQKDYNLIQVARETKQKIDERIGE